MTNDDPRLRSLLRQADKVAQAGKRAAAEQLYRDIVNEFPDVAAGWAGLAEVLTVLEEKRQAYERALSLEPGNEVAQAGLATLDGRTAVKTAESAPSPPPSVEDAGFQQLQAKLTAAVETEKQQGRETAVSSPPPAVEEPQETNKLSCYRHPQRSTSLRCYTCGNPICIQCAIKTPVGYRCPQCVRELENTYFNATLVHYVIGVLVTLPLAAILGYIANFVGFFILFLGAAAGGLIGRVVFFAMGRRRGRWLPHIIAVTILLGALVGGLGPVIPVFLLSGDWRVLIMGSTRLLWSAICAVVAASTAFYWVK